jgi:hypothetical protein
MCEAAPGVAQVVERERGDGTAQAPRADRQRGGVTPDAAIEVAGSEHPERGVDRYWSAAGLGDGTGGRAGARADVEHRPSGRRAGLWCTSTRARRSSTRAGPADQAEPVRLYARVMSASRSSRRLDSQPRRTLTGPVEPPLQLFVVTQRFLPAELHEAAEQA